MSAPRSAATQRQTLTTHMSLDGAGNPNNDISKIVTFMLSHHGQGITLEQRGQLRLPILVLAGSEDCFESKRRYAEAWRDGFTGGWSTKAPTGCFS